MIPGVVLSSHNSDSSRDKYLISGPSYIAPSGPVRSIWSGWRLTQAPLVQNPLFSEAHSHHVVDEADEPESTRPTIGFRTEAGAHLDAPSQERLE